MSLCVLIIFVFFFQAEDGIRDVERSRGLGDVYKRQDYPGICSVSSLERGTLMHISWSVLSEKIR